MKVLLTSGGTKVPIDTVRHIGNMSKGTFGREIGLSGLHTGWDLNFIYADGSKAPHKLEIDVRDDTSDISKEVKRINSLIDGGQYRNCAYKDFDGYTRLVHAQIKSFEPDVIILAAAVSDYGCVPVIGKIRSKGNLTLGLEPLPKIISGIRTRAPNALLVGFKLLVNSLEDELIAEARKSLVNNRCDLVIANDLRDIRNSEHKVIFVTADTVESHIVNCAKEVVKKVNDMYRIKS